MFWAVLTTVPFSQYVYLYILSIDEGFHETKSHVYRAPYFKICLQLFQRSLNCLYIRVIPFFIAIFMNLYFGTYLFHTQ